TSYTHGRADSARNTSAFADHRHPTLDMSRASLIAAMRHHSEFERGSTALRVLGIGLITAMFAAAIGVIAVFTFAVTVDGHSMDPTLRTGDRLSSNFLSRDDIERFDLVEATEPGRSTRLVKRVIGMPGDT